MEPIFLCDRTSLQVALNSQKSKAPSGSCESDLDMALEGALAKEQPCVMCWFLHLDEPLSENLPPFCSCSNVAIGIQA